MGKKTVLVVCNGNIHRSVIAQLCFSRELVNIGEKTEFEVLSRGISAHMYPDLRNYEMEYGHTEPCLKKIGVEIPIEQKATLIDEEVVKRASLILAMDDVVLRILTAQFFDYVSKMRLFMELVGKKENVADCGGIDDAALHRKVVTCINEVTKAGIHTMIRLACESY